MATLREALATVMTDAQPHTLHKATMKGSQAASSQHLIDRCPDAAPAATCRYARAATFAPDVMRRGAAPSRRHASFITAPRLLAQTRSLILPLCCNDNGRTVIFTSSASPPPSTRTAHADTFVRPAAPRGAKSRSDSHRHRRLSLEMRRCGGRFAFCASRAVSEAPPCRRAATQRGALVEFSAADALATMPFATIEEALSVEELFHFAGSGRQRGARQRHRCPPPSAPRRHRRAHGDTQQIILQSATAETSAEAHGADVSPKQHERASPTPPPVTLFSDS